MQDKKILLVGGGTAGHIYPLFAVAEKLKKNKKFNYDFVYIGSGKTIEKGVAKSYGIRYQGLVCGKFRRTSSLLSYFENILDIFLIVIGFFQSIILLFREKPNLIFSKSGYVSVPLVLASKLFAVPTIAHESDLVPGLSTRIILPYVKRLAVAFPLVNYPRNIVKKAFYSGIPLRSEFDDKRNIREKFILVMGGSSGSLNLNNDFFEIAEDVLRKHNVVHITGGADFERAKKFRKSLEKNLATNYEIFSYSQNIDELIRRSKFVISRAGATSIFEIAAFNKKAIFVPIEKNVTDHQSVNAHYIEKHKMGLIYNHSQKSTKLFDLINRIEQYETNISSLSFGLSGELLSRVIEDELDFQNFGKEKNIFMIGIGGVSMSGLANIFTGLGKKVSGSDIKLGGHKATNINIGQDLVVYSSAAGVKSGAREEHLRAQELKIPTIKRSEAIGRLLGGYCGVSVSGMHGKTTTTSMLAQLLSLTGFNPSFLIGAPSTVDNPASHLDSGLMFVNEACEYDGSFLDFKTFYAVITNIEEEHLDYFKGGITQILDEFGRFVENIYPGGALVYCADDKNSMRLISKYSEQLEKKNISIISYGFKPSSGFSIRDYKTSEKGISFRVKGKEQTYEFESDLMGQHIALDYCAVVALANHFGLNQFEIESGFKLFSNASRRFEFVGKRNGVSVFDDYGHHPTEIETTLQALAERYPKTRKFVIYEPHQQNRMNNFFDEFARVFKKSKIDKLVVLPVYRVAGRDDESGKNNRDLVFSINSSAEDKALALDSYEEAQNYLSQNVKEGDLILTMGATNVYQIGRKYLSKG